MNDRAMSEKERADIRLADAVEAGACRDMYAAAPPALGARVETVAGASVLLVPPVPATWFNRVIGLGDGERPAQDADLARIAEIYRVAGVREWWLHLTPAAEPATLPQQLATRGFVLPPRGRWAKFLRGPEAPPPVHTNLLVRQAGPRDDDAVAHIVCTGFGMPPSLGGWFSALGRRPGWTVFVACDGDRPVGTGAVFIAEKNAWLGVGAVLPESRNRGAQGALLAARIRAAAAAGCSTLVTETGEPVGDEHNPSLANIRRLGFRQVCSRLNYVRS